MKIKTIFGLIGCLLLVLSSGAHSILGWKAMSEQLAQTNAPADLVLGLEIDWKFGVSHGAEGTNLGTFGTFRTIGTVRTLFLG